MARPSPLKVSRRHSNARPVADGEYVEVNPTFATAGEHETVLTVTDDEGASANVPLTLQTTEEYDPFDYVYGWSCSCSGYGIEVNVGYDYSGEPALSAETEYRPWLLFTAGSGAKWLSYVTVCASNGPLDYGGRWMVNGATYVDCQTCNLPAFDSFLTQFTAPPEGYYFIHHTYILVVNDEKVASIGWETHPKQDQWDAGYTIDAVQEQSGSVTFPQLAGYSDSSCDEQYALYW